MSGVRGPNSALTEFLRSQGINATEIRRRHERRQQRRAEQEQENEERENAEEGDDASDQSDVKVEETSEPHEDPEVLRIAQAAARKRRGDFGDLDDAQAANEGTAICAFCNSRFTLTVYSKPAPGGDEDSFLCRNCSAKTVQEAKAAARAKRGINKAAASKRRKKLSAELLDMRFLVPPSLQDICINMVVEYIDSIDELGELTVTSFNKISRILGKNRRLTPQTMQLFLRRDVRILEFWDCSKLLPEAFNLIPAMCPNLERLVLGMCGMLNDENLKRLQSLKHLKELHLDGPFMIRKDGWLDFLDERGPHLTKLTITSVYRIDAEVMANLVENCTNLEYLRLSRLCQLWDPTPFYLLGNLTSLRHLELVEMEPEAWSDDAIVHTLNSIGSQLESLVIKGAETKVSDRIVEAIAACCANLRSLELVNLTAISEEAIIDLFTRWREDNLNTGLLKLNLERCFQVGDDAIQEAIKHSGPTLVDLNINSLKGVKKSTIERLAELPNLTKLDVGFVGSIDPMQIYKLSTSQTLKNVLAFGNIRLSGMPLPTGLTVVGTM